MSDDATKRSMAGPDGITEYVDALLEAGCVPLRDGSGLWFLPGDGVWALPMREAIAALRVRVPTPKELPHLRREFHDFVPRRLA